MQSHSKLSLYIGLLRPKTLLSGLSPIIVAVAYAYSKGYVEPLLSFLLLLVAVSAQIASNVVNDWLDYRRGGDTEERLGPLRPLSKGLLSEGEVKWALWISLAVLLISGLAVMSLSSWWLALVGLAVVLGLWAYSGGPYPLSYHGLGELAVLVFFGWVPILASYYVLSGQMPDINLSLLATSLGLASVNILVVNNYRDAEEDRKVGKRTLIVRMGRDFAPRLYLSCAMLSLLLLYPYYSAIGLWLIILYASLVMRAYRHLQTRQGAELNLSLAESARNVFFLSLLVVILILLK